MLLGVFLWTRIQATQVSTSISQDRLATLNSGWVDEARCAECHEQAETFWETGHANTLRRATDPVSRELLKQMQTFLTQEIPGANLTMEADAQVATYEQDGNLSRVELDWCFGSGEHARTWVGTLTDSNGSLDLLEYRWSWFHDIEGFALTPGQQKEPLAGYFHGLGLLFDAPKAKNCFSCHASAISETAGMIDLQTMHPGVTCQRCHGPRAEHVASKGEVTDDFWRTVSQMESINRCAECHRRAEEQDPEDVNRQNPQIVRFQPVGLVQAPCFKGSEMTCLTCHDPHQTLSAQDSMGVWQCFQCHDGTQAHQAFCSAGHRDDCMQCHMPKVAMDSPVKFTDHWIRIRSASETSE